MRLPWLDGELSSEGARKELVICGENNLLSSSGIGWSDGVYYFCLNDELTLDNLSILCITEDRGGN